MVNIYFFATDAGDFTPQSVDLVSETTAARISPDVKRGCWCDAGISVKRTLSAAVSSFWLRFYLYPLNQFSTDFIYLTKGSTRLFRIRRTGSNGNFLVQGWNGSTWTTLLDSTWAPANSTRYKVDIEIVISNSGTINFYAGDVLEASFSGDTLLTADTTIDAFEIVMDGATYVVSGMFISDTDSRAIRMVQSNITGNGTNTAWDGVYTDIDELGVPNDTDIISTGLSNQLETFTKEAFPAEFATGFNCLGIGVRARALRAVTGPQNLQLACRSGTTDGVSATQALDVTMAPYAAFFNQDPDTATDWVVADADSAEVGVKSIT